MPHATLNQGRRFNSTSFVSSRSAAAFQSETRMNHRVIHTDHLLGGEMDAKSPIKSGVGNEGL